jgi:transcriptional regulator with XRE-family HTH domain
MKNTLDRDNSQNIITQAGKRFQELRLIKNLSLKEIERITKIDEQSIASFEEGGSIAASDLYLLCIAVGLPIEKMFSPDKTEFDSFKNTIKEHEWKPELYIACLEMIDRKMEKSDIQLSAKDVIMKSELLYVYSMEKGAPDNKFADILLSVN